MRCLDALDAFLTCDPSEWDAGTVHDGDLSRHLASCARCRNVAATLARGTRAAAVVLATPRRASRRRVVAVRTAIGLAAAAGIALVVSRGSENRDPGPSSVPVVTAQVPVNSTASLPPDSQPVSAAPVVARTARTTITVTGRPARATAVIAALPTVTVDTAVTTTTAPPPQEPALQVEVAAGQHAAIIRTADPKITIVWIY